MTKKLPNAFALAAAAVFMAAFTAVAPAAAHHSHSMFDLTVEESITGSVKAFAFQNPHVFLYVNVTANGAANPTTYTIEMSHVQNMLRRGISAATFKPGDIVTVKINPLHGGRPGGQYITISKDGKDYGRGAGE